MKKLKFILSFFIIFFTLGVAKDLFFQSLLEKRIAEVTGLQTTVGTLHVSLFHSTLEAKEILLYNPKGVETRIFGRISNLFVSFNLPEFLKGKYHFREMRLVLEELFILKNQEGLMNLEELRTVGKTFPLTIDKLDLDIQRIVYRNNEINPPTVHEFGPMIRHEQFENLRSMEELIEVVFLRSLPKELFISSE